jgi:hypothetical protein
MPGEGLAKNKIVSKKVKVNPCKNENYQKQSCEERMKEHIRDIYFHSEIIKWDRDPGSCKDESMDCE